ncbi:hypothetical protein [Paracoccus sp. (in: a-proteobacteria)]|uniref:hypothetical protein n=1 Tax=Paracoccus sp. TaxID=267 RepID=UPI0035B3D2DC
MKTTTILSTCLAAALVSGCMAPAPAPAPVPAPVAYVPPAPQPAVGVAGLTERKPDLCGASQNYASAIGQPGSIIPTLGVTSEYRVVEYRGIEPQDYVPSRVVFRLDAAGIITNVDCG